MEELRLQEELRKARQELLLLYEIGNLIRTTLLLDEVEYLILSAVTSHEGLGYNRAILFMVDESGVFLEGKMGIGPTHAEAAPNLWKMIEEKKITLEGLLDVYRKADKKIDVELNRVITTLRLPIEKNHGVLAKAVIHDKPSYVPKLESKHELSDLNLISLGIEEFIVVPIRGKDSVVGVMLVDNISTKRPLGEHDVRRIMMLANHAGLALENAKTYSDIVTTAHQDSLTKLWNHGHFQNILTDALREARTRGTSVSLIVFDIDDFKHYNDTFGHQAGDRALEAVSQISKTVVRRADNLARYGGEEFVAILPGTTKAEAMKLAERLRETIERDTEAALSNGVPRKITVSVGVSTFPDDADDREKLIFCADGALYEAKRAGKNKVRAYRKTAAPQK